MGFHGPLAVCCGCDSFHTHQWEDHQTDGDEYDRGYRLSDTYFIKTQTRTTCKNKKLAKKYIAELDVDLYQDVVMF